MMDHSEFTSFARSTYYKDTGKHEFTKKKNIMSNVRKHPESEKGSDLKQKNKTKSKSAIAIIFIRLLFCRRSKHRK